MTIELSRIGAEEAERIAYDASLAVYPLVLLDAARRRHPSAPNHFVHIRPRSAEDVIGLANPNAHVLYSSAWLDLSAGPVALRLPDMRRHYMVMPMLSAWGEVFASLGVRTLGPEPSETLIAGPGWTAPPSAGERLVRAPTDAVWLLARTLLDSDEDHVAEQLQRRFVISPLGPSPRSHDPPPRLNHWPSWPSDALTGMRPDTYLDRASRLIAESPAPRSEAGLIARLARIGVIAGRPFCAAGLPQSAAEAVRRGVGRALAAIASEAWSADQDGPDHWMVSAQDGGMATPPLERAAIAHRCLGFNLKEDAAYFLARSDADGRPLHGGVNYRLRFRPNAVPPVVAFWSLTAYDLKDRLIGSLDGRCSLLSRDCLCPGPDGSLDVRIQYERPFGPLGVNWLPVPRREFRLVLRAYWPGPAILRGDWRPPAVRRIALARGRPLVPGARGGSRQSQWEAPPPPG